MRNLGDARKDDSGAVLVFTVIVLVVLIGMAALAIDIGQMYIAKQRAQNVCDAAALAGVQELAVEAEMMNSGSGYVVDTDPAQATAEECASANNDDVPSWRIVNPDSETPGIKVTFPDAGETVKWDSGRDELVQYRGQVIRVDGKVNVETAFAGIFGMYNKFIPAKAIAMIKCLQSKDIIPLTGSKLTVSGDGTTPPIQSKVLYTLHAGSWQDGYLGPGNYLTLRFGDDSGANDYRDRLAGEGGEVSLCQGVVNLDVANTEPGAMPVQTFKGLEDRLLQEPIGSLYAYDKQDPIGSGDTAWTEWLKSGLDGVYDNTRRLAVIPLLEETIADVNGMKQVTIAGFAGFFIRNFYGSQDVIDPDGTVHYAGDVQGYFVWGRVVGGEIKWYLSPEGTTPIGANMIISTRLIS